jgi:hypothetical protein
LNSSYELHQDDATGSIDVGKLADLIVLDRNFFTFQPSGLPTSKSCGRLSAAEPCTTPRALPAPDKAPKHLHQRTDVDAAPTGLEPAEALRTRSQDLYTAPDIATLTPYRLRASEGFYTGVESGRLLTAVQHFLNWLRQNCDTRDSAGRNSLFGSPVGRQVDPSDLGTQHEQKGAQNL